MKTGILGGTFDPIHTGHITVADVVREELGLAEIIFVPAARPWLKSGTFILSAEHRLDMVRLAITSKSYFKVSTGEIERKGPTFSIDTVTEMKREIGDNDELLFIIGWDNLSELPRWYQPKRLIRLCRLVAVPRAGFPVPDLGSLEAAIPGISRRVIMLDKPRIDISASVIRERVRLRLPIGHLVPKAVEKYIEDNALYRE
jgi:nicotinate-nucleotide adenylyltransferase